MEYTTMQLSRLVGLDKAQIIHAVQIGIIKPAQDARGRGYSRKYSEHNMKQFLAMEILMRAKMPLREIGDILEKWNDVDGLILKAKEFYALYYQLRAMS